MYKVFIQNKALTFDFVDKISEKNGICISENAALHSRERVLQLSKNSEVTIFSRNPLLSLERFFADHEWIEAAGGIVQRKQKFLVIKRLGTWDLPKGKMDLGEIPEKTAIREIEEECGISKPEIQSFIGESYHTYVFKGRKTIKKTYWYHLSYMGSKNTAPQTEEDISEVKWVDLQELKTIQLKTYDSLKEIISTFIAKMLN